MSAARDGSGRDGAGEEAARRGYHHGGLKDALIEAARALIQQRGPSGFSLTEAARAVGVTPAAPYRHFSDRDALMGEVARRGFDLFLRRLAEAWDNGSPAPEAALARMARAHLGFAHDEPGYYRSMFSSACEGAVGAGPGEEAFELLTVAAGVALGARGAPGGGARALALEIWALSHGAAMLMLRNRLPVTGAEEAVAMLERGVRSLVAGAASQSRR